MTGPVGPPVGPVDETVKTFVEHVELPVMSVMHSVKVFEPDTNVLTNGEMQGDVLTPLSMHVAVDPADMIQVQVSTLPLTVQVGIGGGGGEI